MSNIQLTDYFLLLKNSNDYTKKLLRKNEIILALAKIAQTFACDFKKLSG
jgi:hypothetical protein